MTGQGKDDILIQVAA